MSKQLSMKEIKADSQKYNEYIEIPLQDDKYVVKVYPYFSPSKVSVLLNDLTNFYRNATEEKVNLNSENFDDILGYFIVRHFSDIKMTKSKKAKMIFEEFKLAQNSTLFELILKSIPEESIDYLFGKVYELIEFSAKLETRLKLAQDQMKNVNLDVENHLNNKEKIIPEM
ncbi:hypothetical protein COE51_16375 [Bacillus pseudomycoides]|nr:hypothetical protein COE51_16375 [Bacillus pseudomycoides]